MTRSASPALLFSIHFLCILLSSASAQINPDAPSFIFRTLTQKDGLNARWINSVLKDKQGYMWFSNNFGLIRYDGKSFKPYYYIPNDTTSLSTNAVGALMQDKQGYIWIATTQGGINRYDPSTDRFTRFQHTEEDSASLSINQVVSFFQDSEDDIWIATTWGGLNLFNKKTNTFQHWKPGQPSVNKSLKDINTFIGMVEDRTRKHQLWLTGSGGLYNFDKRTRQFTYYCPPDSLFKEPLYTRHQKEDLYALYPENDSILWTGNAYGELFRFNIFSKEWKRFKTGNWIIGSIVSLGKDIIWLGTDRNEGIWMFNTRTFALKQLTHDPKLPVTHTLPANDVVTLYKDNTGILWITHNDKISRIDPRMQLFTYYPLPQPEIPEPLSRIPFVSAMLEDTSTHTLYMTEHPTHRMIAVDQLRGKTESINLDYSAYFNLFKGVLVYRMYPRDKNSIWLITEKGLYAFDKNKKTVHSFADIFGLPGQPLLIDVRSLLEDRDGNFWIGTRNHDLLKFNPKTKTFENLNKTLPRAYSVYDLYQDDKGYIWAATDNGLFIFDPRTDTLLDTDTYLTEHEYLQTSKFYCIEADTKGNIWLGTIGKGLCRITPSQPKQNRLKIYTMKDGLPDHNIQLIKTDTDGNIWGSTYNGRFQLDPETDEVKSYHLADGLPIGQLGDGFIVDWQGKIVWCGMPGYYVYNPSTVSKNTTIPPVVINAMQILTQEDSRTTHINFTKELTLPYDQNFISFTFSVLDYTKPEDNRYAYQLEGFDNGWRDNGNSGYANYTGLPPGNYVFRVKGANNDGVWNHTGKSVRITIMPPPWKSWWAYTLYTIAFAGVLSGVYTFLLNRQKLQNDLQLQRIAAQKLQEVDELKSRFFANISHEFRTPLTLILGPLENFMSQTSSQSPEYRQYQLMHRNARHLQTLINQLLDLSRLEAGSMNLQVVQADVIAFLKPILYAYTSLADRKKIEYTISFEQESLGMEFDPDKLEKIINNLLSNAFKFTPQQGKILVSVSRAVGKLTGQSINSAPEQLLEFTIQDTGIGIAEDQLAHIFDRFYQVDNSFTREYEGSGIGLAFVKELTELHGGKIQVRSKPGEGSTFTLQLPQLCTQPQRTTAVMANEPLLNTFVQPADQEPGATSAATLGKVMVVEDNSDLRYYIRQSLHLHYHILEAENGLQAWQMALEYIPDLIISDLMMPKLDGYRLCRRLKSDERTSHIPVIMLTARADLDSKIQGLENEADDYIAKPFDLKELQVRMTNLMEGRKKLKAHYQRILTLQPADIQLNSAEEVFLAKVMQVIEKFISASDFDVDTFAREIGMSRSQFYRKIAALTGKSPNEFIRDMRLKRAAQLLAQHKGTVAEIAYEVGFSNPSYFAKCFKELYGKLPSEYVNGFTNSM